MRRVLFSLLLLASLAGDAHAQGVPCVGPNQGNCVAVVQVEPAAGLAGYPANATPVTGSGTGSTGAVSASLPAASGKFTYICGFAYQGSDATAAVAGNIAVSGTVTGTMNFGYVALAAGTTVPQPPPAVVEFSPCVPSSAVNTAVTVTPPTLGTGATLATVSAWGYQL
jgi:hypothetical protein